MKDLRSSDVKDLEAPTSATGNELVPVELNGRDVQITAQMIANLGGGGGTVSSVNGHTGVVTLGAADVSADASGAAAAAQAASQPVDSDLTAIAALTTQTFGRARLTDPDAATAKGALAIAESDVANLTTDLTEIETDITALESTVAGPNTIPESAITSLTSDLAAKAPLASPALTGAPTAPTATAGDNTTQIATDAFVTTAVNNAIGGLNTKPDVAYVSTSALPANTYNNGASGVGATLTGNSNGPLIIDTVTILAAQAGERVLVAGEAAPANNGWYTITTVGVVAVSKYVLTRATESDQAAEIGAGYLTGVVAPNTVVPGANNGKLYISVAADPFTVGTTSITYSQVGSTYSAGTGIGLSGTTFSIDTAVTVDKTTAQTLTNKTLTSPALTTPTGIVESDIANLSSDLTEIETDIAALESTVAGPATIPESAVTNLTSDLALKAPIASPTLTGVVGLPLGESAVTAPLGSLITREGGIYIGKRALDKWRYTNKNNRTVVCVGDSLCQGNVGGSDPWVERLARDVGNWNGPRLTAGAGFYPLYRSGSLLFSGNGDREWFPWGPWTIASTQNYNLSPYNSSVIVTNASATAIRTVADGATTSNLTTVTSATMAFVAGDVGALITGTNIPPNSRIIAVTNGTTCAISQRATATGASLALSIHGATLTWKRGVGQTNSSRVMNDCTFATNTTLVCPSANFAAADVGRMVTATGGTLSANTTITAVTDYQTATISAASLQSIVGRLIIHEGRTVADAVTATNTTLTSATAVFTSADCDCKVVGTNIPAGTFIASVESPISCTLSVATTGTGSALFLFINASGAQRSVPDMVCGSSTTITSASAAFTKSDIGRHIVGSNIPNNTTITAVASNTSVTISIAATAAAGTNGGGELTVGSTTPIIISHLEILWIDGIASHGTNFTYSTDGGATWVQVAQTTTGGPYLMKTLVTITNPTTLIIRANTGPGNSPTTKSQTIQCGINAYQSAPSGAGVNIFNAARDGLTLTTLAAGGFAGDPFAFFDNGLGGTTTAGTSTQPFGGYRPDLVIVLFINDQTLFTVTDYTNAMNRILDRVNLYADVIFIGTYQAGGGTPSLATTQAYNAAAKARALSSGSMTWAVTDGVTNTTTAITSATMRFTKQDIGRAITGTDIPAATKISAVTSATAATLSQAATGSHSGCTFTIAGSAPDTGAAFLDLYEAYTAEGVAGFTAANTDGLMYDNLHPSQVGHNEIGGRMSRIMRVFS